MNIAIVDDSLLDRTILVRSIKKHFPQTEDINITEYSNGEDLIVAFDRGMYDYIFLDINMPGLTGIETAKALRTIDNRFKLIFITSSNEYAAESYDVNCVYYLCKPFEEETFIKMLARILPRTGRRADDVQSISLPNGTTFMPRNISYTEYYNHKITIYQIIGDPIECYIKQSEFEELIANYNFLFVCNKGSIVNFECIESVDEADIYLKNGDVISVSRRRKKEFDEAYQNFKFKKINGELK